MSTNTNTTSQQIPSDPGDVPATVGGRPITGFATAGVSVSLPSPSDEANAAIAQFTLASLQRGLLTGVVHADGRTPVTRGPYDE